MPFGPVPLTLDPVGAIIIGYRIIVPAVNYLLISVCPNKNKSKKSRFSLLSQTQRPVCYTIRLSRGPWQVLTITFVGHLHVSWLGLQNINVLIFLLYIKVTWINVFLDLCSFAHALITSILFHFRFKWHFRILTAPEPPFWLNYILNILWKYPMKHQLHVTSG